MRSLFLAALMLYAFTGIARADDPLSFNLTIKYHHFTPAEIIVPAGKSFVINVKNLDPLAEEFDSTALKVEKVIAGGSSGTVHIHALDPGQYKFMGEYHSDTAQGVVIAK